VTEKTNICVICAWRAGCQKKFSLSGKDARCADFTEDVSLRKKTPPPEKQREEDEKER
jgi:hypothetical protein